jgi:DNA polymerase (family 10)
VHVAAARDYGIPIVLGTDAHATEELRFLEFGVWQARRAGLTKADVVNTKTWAQFRKLLRKRKV